MTELSTATAIATLEDADMLPVRKGGAAGLLRMTLAQLKAYIGVGGGGGGTTPGAGYGAHRYWRLYDVFAAGGGNPIIGEVHFKNAAGVILNYTVTQWSSILAGNPNYAGTKMNDGDAGSIAVPASGDAHPWYVIDFGGAVEPRKIGVILAGDGGWLASAPRSLTLQYSTDGTTWVDATGVVFGAYTYNVEQYVDVPQPAGGPYYVPMGGTAGQVLSKNSNTDGDTTWADPAAGGGGAGLPALTGNGGKILGVKSDASGTEWIAKPSGGGGGGALSGPIPGMYDGTPHKYWRVTFPGGLNGAYYNNVVSEIEMRGSIGGANLCTGGTVQGAPNPANAFDGSTSSFWTLGDAGAAGWAQYTFASPVTVRELALFSRTDGAGQQAPWAFSFAYSDDGLLWTNVVSGIMVGTNSGRTEYDYPVPIVSAAASASAIDASALGTRHADLTLVEDQDFGVDLAGPGGSDTQYFYAVRGITGDFDVKARVVNGGWNNYASCGIIARNSADGSGLTSMVTWGGAWSNESDTVGAGGARVDGNGAGIGYSAWWVRLARVGSTTTAYGSPDGKRWFQIRQTSGAVDQVGIMVRRANCPQVGGLITRYDDGTVKWGRPDGGRSI